MILQMVGIEHEKASVGIREQFAFQTHDGKEAMKFLKHTYELEGCVILSTCNRTELYVSTEEEKKDIFGMLCHAKHIDKNKFGHIYTERKNEEVIQHLFALSCGMKSKIFGEDQIITQVKQALALAREAETADIVLEKAFQMAVTAAKKVKSEVYITSVKTSVIENMMEMLKKEFGSLAELSCMVIGNGKIGRLACERLLEAGARVTVTLRQYKSGEIEVEDGCETIPYSDRYEKLPTCQVVVSATASPHHTIHYEDASPYLGDGKKRVYVDLAVPRDISERVKGFPSLTLYNVDDLGGIQQDKVNNEAVRRAFEIIEEYKQEYIVWNAFRSYVPIVQSIGRMSGLSAYKKIEKKLEQYVKTEQKYEVEQLMRGATEKVVTSLLYGLKDNIPVEVIAECLRVMENKLLEY